MLLNINRYKQIIIKTEYKKQGKTQWFCPVSILGGDKGSRTPDLLHAKQPLSHLSYIPIAENHRQCGGFVAGVQGLEPWARGFGDRCSTN